jgi:hypothetical protein
MRMCVDRYREDETTRCYLVCCDRAGTATRFNAASVPSCISTAAGDPPTPLWLPLIRRSAAFAAAGVL